MTRTGSGHRSRMSTSSSDLRRCTAVTIAEVLCVLGTLLGVGVFGGPQVAEAANGALSADATLLAPATQAFSIWSVIYIGLAVYTVWQWLPAQRTADRHRAIGWWVAASMVLNALWLLVVRAGWVWVSVGVIAVLVVVLGVIVRRIAASSATGPADGRVDTLITAGTFGLYVGWVSVAVCANVTAALVDSGVQPGMIAAELWAVLVLVVAGVVGTVLALRTRGNLGVGLAMAWGISWIAVARLTGEPASTTTGVAAIVVAAAIAVVTVLVRIRAAQTADSGGATPIGRSRAATAR